MKTTILLTLSLVSLQTFAAGPIDFCDGFSTSREECLEIIKGGTFQDDALEICEEFLDPNRSLNCLRTIKNAMIETKAVEICDYFAVEANIIKCLKVSSNKLMKNKDIEACDQKREVSEVISCLEKL